MKRITIATIALVGLAMWTAEASWAYGPGQGRGQGQGQGQGRGQGVAAGLCDGTGQGVGRGLRNGQGRGQQGRQGQMGQGKGAQRGQQRFCDQQCLFDPDGPPLNDAEKQVLLSMRQEEKLARDVYMTLYDKWQVRAFRNISRAEQRHMNALGRAIDRYDLEDPIEGDGLGVFADPEFAALYEKLVSMGSESLEEALKVGALIEEMDIVDLQEALAEVDHADVKQVYENLMRGSRNHLRSFAGQIEAAGVSYAAQHLTQEEFDKIAASPTEPGKGRKAGRGVGRGAGRGSGRGAGQGKGLAGQGRGMGAGRNGGAGACDCSGQGKARGQAGGRNWRKGDCARGGNGRGSGRSGNGRGSCRRAY